MTVRDLQEQLELKTAEIVDLNMQINSLHQQLLDTRIRSEKEVYTNPNKKVNINIIINMYVIRSGKTCLLHTW